MLSSLTLKIGERKGGRRKKRKKGVEEEKEKRRGEGEDRRG